MPTPLRVRAIAILVLFLSVVATERVDAITIRIDYSTDTTGFFGANNPQGPMGAAQAKNALAAAAQFYSGVLEDTFTEIVPEKFYGSLGGEASFFWKRRFIDPATGLNNAAVNQEINANEYVVFVGARDLPGAAVGLGGPGGFDHIISNKHGQFTSAENTQVNQMLDDLSSAISDRGQSSGFARWGGSIAFESPTTTTWHFNHTTSPGAGTTDFYSVALHELGHALGFGGSDEWDALASGTGFTGANAVASYVPAGNVPLAVGDSEGHWVAGIANSPVYEGAGMQIPLMVPSLLPATRRVLTDLDAAALADLGWEIDLAGGAASAASFVNGSESSQSAVLVALTSPELPEPAGAVLVSLAALGLMLVKSRRR